MTYTTQLQSSLPRGYAAMLKKKRVSADASALKHENPVLNEVLSLKEQGKTKEELVAAMTQIIEDAYAE